MADLLPLATVAFAAFVSALPWIATIGGPLVIGLWAHWMWRTGNAQDERREGDGIRRTVEDDYRRSQE